LAFYVRNRFGKSQSGEKWGRLASIDLKAVKGFLVLAAAFGAAALIDWLAS
jgi:hypothetical protein